MQVGGTQNTYTTMSESIVTPKVLADAIVNQAVNQPSEEELKRQERLQLLQSLRITTQTVVEPERPSLSVDGVGFFAINDIHAVKAKQKQGKTTTLKICAASLLSGQMFRVKSELTEPVVLWLDTEQKAADVKLIISDVKQMTGLDDEHIDGRLKLYPLRKMNYETLMTDTRLLIDEHQPQVVIIDGVVDFVASFNDEVASRQLIHDLLVLCEERHCAIVTVLHENKAADDTNMRGHLGTVLSQAAGTVLECRKSKSGIITVCCTDPRHGVTPPWSFRFDQDGNILDADALRQEEKRQKAEAKKQQKQAEKDRVVKERLDYALLCIRDHGGSISRKELTGMLMNNFELERSTVSKFITSQVKDKMLYEVNKEITSSPDMALAF